MVQWRGPIGCADLPNWLRSAIIQLKTAEELFKGRHFRLRNRHPVCGDIFD
jgi:hypothetical protein